MNGCNTIAMNMHFEQGVSQEALSHCYECISANEDMLQEGPMPPNPTWPGVSKRKCLPQNRLGLEVSMDLGNSSWGSN